MRTIQLAASAAAAAIVAASAGLPAAAQTFQQGQEITVMQGFQPGGGSDALAQLVQPFLAEELGVNFVNQYIPGATGAIAWTQLARQVTPEDNAVSITNTPMLMTNYIMNEAITYSIEEITPLANVITDPGVMVVRADSPYQTFEDLIEAARANPGTITIGNSGVGGDDFFSSVMIERAAGVEFQKVPFQGDGPSWQAALGGQIDASDNNLGITYPQIEAGNLRVLAVFSEERIEQIPDVPTLRELGYDVVAGSSRGYSGPAGMSEEAIAEFDAAMQRVVENPEFQQAAAARAFNIEYMDSATYAEFLREQERVFQAIWDEIGDDVDMN
jgi:putative tricarboxylic transport membrane protein